MPLPQRATPPALPPRSRPAWRRPGRPRRSSTTRALYKQLYHDLKEQLNATAPTAPEANPNTYELRWEVDEAGNPTANVKDLKLSHSLTVAKGVTVVVRSWNAKQSKGFTAYYPSKGKTTQPGKASPFGNQQVYSITRGGLTQDGATQLAQKTHAEITQHEMKLRAMLPGDNILTATVLVRLTGTGTAFDQDYYVESVTRSMSVQGGYGMTLSAKNHSPDSVPSP